MSVTYEDALQTLKSMFSDFDEETIGVVLQSNNGHMERTVDVLLSMGGELGGGGGGGGGNSANGGSSQQAAPAASIDGDAEFARRLAQQEEEEARQSSSSSRAPESSASQQKNRGTPITLPDDFLRVQAGGGDGGDQMHQDELLAQMMQDEMFMQELRQHPEFATLGNTGRPSAGRDNAAARGSGGGGSGRPSSGSGDMANTAMRNVSLMGAAARRKMATLAMKFKEKTNNSASSRYEGAHRPLMNDDDDDDEDDAEVITFDSNTGAVHRAGGGMINRSSFELADELDDNRPFNRNQKKDR